MSNKIKVGVFGCGRGRTMVEVMSQHPDAELVAICDKWEQGLKECEELAEKFGVKLTTYKDFDKFLEHGLDAVVLANYAIEHAPYAIKCLNAGIHVVSEVLAVNSIEEAYDLVKAVRNSKAIYSYAENYCYFKCAREMTKLYKRGDIGELLHAEGEYIHFINYADRGPLTENHDPKHWRNQCSSTFYCTHASGPIIHSTGLRPIEVMGIEVGITNDKAFGWEDNKKPSGAMIIARLENGAICKFCPSCPYPRVPEAIWYVMYGTKGMMESDRWGATVNRIHVYHEPDVDNAKNVPIEDRHFYYEPDFNDCDLAKRVAGHAGSDFFTMDVFIDAILGRKSTEEMIDVYEALDMTLLGPLAQESMKQGGKALPVPDFRKIEI
ncbi:MAG: Gfo/Idh/MocA family oxidoreductase [Abditibacteriota bacterium]|nr:Gfo/Idh/MocA family oxidoreductase [Abditibacteriota bacterium]